jgi:hypothetical protein
MPTWQRICFLKAYGVCADASLISTRSTLLQKALNQTLRRLAQLRMSCWQPNDISPLVLRWSLHILDYQLLHWAGCRFEPETNLLLKRREQ